MLKYEKAGEIMYLLSLYFDKNDTNKLLNYMQLIEQETKNSYMNDHHIPLHLTLATIHDIDITQLYGELDKIISQINTGTLQLAAIGSFGRHTLYVMPVLDQYLFDLSLQLNQIIDETDHRRCHNRYRPFSWIPHITLARKLNVQQLTSAFALLASNFEPMEIKATRIALSRSHPYQDIAIWSLKEQ